MIDSAARRAVYNAAMGAIADTLYGDTYEISPRTVAFVLKGAL